MRLSFFVLGWACLLFRHPLSNLYGEDYFYLYDIVSSLSNIFFAIGFLICFRKNTPQRLVIDLALSTFIDDLIDRLIFDISHFQPNDIIVNAALILIITYRNKKLISKWMQQLLYRL